MESTTEALHVQLVELKRELDTVRELLADTSEARRQELATRPDGSGHGYPSQVRFNIETADVDTLRREVRHLDDRLCWMYRHYDDGGTIGLVAARTLAEQRDAEREKLAEAVADRDKLQSAVQVANRNTERRGQQRDAALQQVAALEDQLAAALKVVEAAKAYWRLLPPAGAMAPDARDKCVETEFMRSVEAYQQQEPAPTQ